MFLTNFSTSAMNLEWFDHDWEQIKQFTTRNQLNGIELILHGDYDLSKIPEDLVHGLHLSYWPMWLDFWREDRQTLLKQFKNEENIRQFYGGLDAQLLVEHYQKEFAIAQGLGVKYLVFHVGHVELLHTYNWNFTYTNWDVLEAAVELINQSFPENDQNIVLLFENLWWPGLNLLDDELTRKFFQKIHYRNKGLMLDIAHLMITNSNLRDEQEASDYILKQIDDLGELKEQIRGVHLSSSLPGEYLREDHSEELARVAEIQGIWEQYVAAIPHIKKIDRHQPFRDQSIRKIIAEIEPEYTVFEVLPRDAVEFENFIREQNLALGRL